MKTIYVRVGTDTAAKLQHEASRVGKTVEEIASLFLQEGASTCAFLFSGGASTHPSVQGKESTHAPNI